MLGIRLRETLICRIDPGVKVVHGSQQALKVSVDDVADGDLLLGRGELHILLLLRRHHGSRLCDTTAPEGQMLLEFLCGGALRGAPEPLEAVGAVLSHHA